MKTNGVRLRTTGVGLRTHAIRIRMIGVGLRTHDIRLRMNGVGLRTQYHFDACSSHLNLKMTKKIKK